MLPHPPQSNDIPPNHSNNGPSQQDKKKEEEEEEEEKKRLFADIRAHPPTARQRKKNAQTPRCSVHLCRTGW